MIESKPYFTWRQILVMLVFALAGALTFYFFPVVDIRWPGPFLQPGSAFAVFGGIIFVFWLAVSRLAIGKRYTALVTAVFMASLGGILSPGHLVELHGLASPVAFFIFRYAGIIVIGAILELSGQRLSWRSLPLGGLANLVGVGLVWVAFSIQSISPWHWLRMLTSPWHYVAYALSAVMSGAVGVLLAYLVHRGVKKLLPQPKSDA